jgi:hypothetical protein
MGDDTYLHNVHNERLLQQGVGVENFGCGSLHATMMNVWLVTDRAESRGANNQIIKIVSFIQLTSNKTLALPQENPPPPQPEQNKSNFPPFFYQSANDAIELIYDLTTTK